MAIDPVGEAERLERCAKQRLDGADPAWGADIGRRLLNEWLSLNQTQRDAVAAALLNQNSGPSFNRLPVPRLILNEHCDITGIEWTASGLDVTSRAHSVEMVALEGWASESNPNRGGSEIKEPQP